VKETAERSKEVDSKMIAMRLPFASSPDNDITMPNDSLIMIIWSLSCDADTRHAFRTYSRRKCILSDLYDTVPFTI
jgi:hypothetical protein